jgi:excisionase family DNA binding protein
MTVADLAAYLGCSRSAVYRWVATGAIDHLKVGSRLVRFTPEQARSIARPVGQRRLASMTE